MKKIVKLIGVFIFIVLNINFGELYAQHFGIIHSDFRYDSIIVFDVSDNPLEKTVYTYTQRGMPVATEIYSYNQSTSLLMKGTITEDNGDDFSTLDSIMESESSWIVRKTQSRLDTIGNLVMQKLTVGYDAIELKYNIFYSANNQIDSVFTEIESGGMPIVIEKQKYNYNTDGLLVQSYKKDISGISVVSNNTYTKNNDNKLTKMIVEYYTYENEILNESLNRKEIIYYDLDARPIRKETYDWDLDANNWIENYHTYLIWYYPKHTSITEKKVNTNVVIKRSNEWLIIDSPYTENIEIYSINGACLYRKQKQQGEYPISLNSFSHGIYILKGSCWSKKICW